MGAATLRFLHAAAVQLDGPVRQLGAVPRDTLDILASATLTAWERLIDAAVTQGVDGLFLTGDTFDAEAGSLAADVALRQGLERLAEHDIPAFVIPGWLDPLPAWSELPALPDNVTVFDSAWDAAVELTDGGRTIAVIQPVSAETDVSPPELDRLRLSGRAKPGAHPPSIGLLWDTPEDTATVATGEAAADPRFASLDVLLCRDAAANATLPLTDAKILRQSAPQGMTLAETGSRGATLLQFDPSGQLTTRHITLGPVRRERLTVRLDLARRRDDVADQMLAQLEELPVFPGEQMRLIEWVFTGTDAAWQRLDFTEAAADETVQTLLELTDQPGRLRYGHQAAPLWSGEADDREMGELWRDYLSLFDQRPTATLDELRSLAMELRPQATGATGPWERWLSQLDPAAVAKRSRHYGRRWFAGVR
ncbi:MAG: hypothetical protein SH850_29165 [Planctomycetaceae bacterium]|nr:hypothetical protein [Planctomycetaceae bacterium]